jgi:hypothetical protein
MVLISETMPAAQAGVSVVKAWDAAVAQISTHITEARANGECEN